MNSDFHRTRLVTLKTHPRRWTQWTDATVFKSNYIIWIWLEARITGRTSERFNSGIFASAGAQSSRLPKRNRFANRVSHAFGGCEGLESWLWHASLHKIVVVSIKTIVTCVTRAQTAGDYRYTHCMIKVGQGSIFSSIKLSKYFWRLNFIRSNFV